MWIKYIIYRLKNSFWSLKFLYNFHKRFTKHVTDTVEIGFVEDCIDIYEMRSLNVSEKAAFLNFWCNSFVTEVLGLVSMNVFQIVTMFFKKVNCQKTLIRFRQRIQIVRLKTTLSNICVYTCRHRRVIFQINKQNHSWVQYFI